MPILRPQPSQDVVYLPVPVDELEIVDGPDIKRLLGKHRAPYRGPFSSNGRRDGVKGIFFVKSGASVHVGRVVGTVTDVEPLDASLADSDDPTEWLTVRFSFLAHGSLFECVHYDVTTRIGRLQARPTERS